MGLLISAMKTFITLIAFVAIITSVNAQNFIGVKGGPSLADMPGYKPNVMRVRFVGGVTFDHQLTKFSSIGADLIYSQRGYAWEYVLSQGPNAGGADESNINFSYDYISLPLKYSMQFGGKLKLFSTVAAVPSILLSAKSKMDKYTSPDGIEVGGETDLSEDTMKIDIAVQAEGGISYSLTETYSLLLSASYQRSLTYTHDENFLGRSIYNESIMFALGGKMKIGK